jgi:phosphoglycolate phosphatase-like HAD superfamily hydrolase
MKYLLWDIDGTLLISGGAGIKAIGEAVKQRFHKDDFEFGESMAGRTDSYIIKKIVKNYKKKYTAADAAGFFITYNQIFNKLLPKCNGKLLTNVKTTLEYLENEKDQFTSTLLTGNCKPAGMKKVQYFGIDQHFNIELSAFGELSEDRNLLAEAAYQKISMFDPSVSPNDIIVIGDTSYDVSCAHAIGARSLIILEGKFNSLESIKAKNPWKIIEKLPDNPSDFINLIKD